MQLIEIIPNVFLIISAKIIAVIETLGIIIFYITFSISSLNDHSIRMINHGICVNFSQSILLSLLLSPGLCFIVQVDRARPILVSSWSSVFLFVALFSYGSLQGPVTNHDSSVQERRGHTTLNSGSGACCHPLFTFCPPLVSAAWPANPPCTIGNSPSRAIIALCNKDHHARADSKGQVAFCRCLIFATRPFVRPFVSLRGLSPFCAFCRCHVIGVFSCILTTVFFFFPFFSRIRQMEDQNLE